MDARLNAHRNGDGARLVTVVTQAGIGWELARVWPLGDRTFERGLKKRKNTPKLCPICRRNDMDEFVSHPPCGKKVHQGTLLLGFCTRRQEHEGGCTHLLDDRTDHWLRSYGQADPSRTTPDAPSHAMPPVPSRS